MSNKNTVYNSINDPLLSEGSSSHLQEESGDPTNQIVAISDASEDERVSARSFFYNFVLFSILFSANHGAVVSCISLASARLGDLGTVQNSVLYLSYTLSALFGSTYVIKSIGSFHSIIVGMSIYCIYILSYVIATTATESSMQTLKIVSIISGGFIGGIGGGFLWTAQGSYFASASEIHARMMLQLETTTNSTIAPDENTDNNTNPSGTTLEHITKEKKEQKAIKDSTSFFAGVFACIYLLLEVIMRLFSTFVVQVLKWTWTSVFTGYALTAILSTVLMSSVVNDCNDPQLNQSCAEADTSLVNQDERNDEREEREVISSFTTTQHHPNDTFNKATITFRMLVQDPKMKYMFPVCAIFGLSSVFMNTFVNGEVLRISLNDNKSAYVGLLTSITSATAGIMSIVFGFLSKKTGNATILVIGSISFFMVVFLFMVIPDLENWNIPLLILVYIFQGVGRSTFEGALKAEFALMFTEKEGAFGNIIFQNGLVTTVGFFLASHWYCSTESNGCVKYADGLVHNILGFEILTVIVSFLAIICYLRGKHMYQKELEQSQSALESVQIQNGEDTVI